MNEYFVKTKYFSVDAVRVQYGETSRCTCAFKFAPGTPVSELPVTQESLRSIHTCRLPVPGLISPRALRSIDN